MLSKYYLDSITYETKEKSQKITLDRAHFLIIKVNLKVNQITF